MILTIDELKQNYEKLIKFIEDTFPEPRRTQLLKLHDELGERIILAPASSFSHFHSAFPGGYVVHVLNVIKCAKGQYKLWKFCGADLNGYTEEELMFSALCHDLGKIGDKKNEFYVPCESDWHVKNQGKIYEINPKLPNMRHQDRSLFTLQEYGILITENEYLAILLHDGVFESSNDFYLKTMNEDRIIRTNISLILWQADYMAYRIEHETWRNSKKTERYNPLKKEKPTRPDNSDDKFDSLFK